MLVEALRPKREAQLHTPTAEITGLPVFPRFPDLITSSSGIIADSMKTISLARPDRHPLECVVGKVSSSSAKLVSRLAKVISDGIGITTKGLEKVSSQVRGRRPRCSHGYRFDDATRHCDCGKFRAQLTNTLFKIPSRRSGLTTQPQGII